MNMTLRVIIDILLVLGAFFTFVGVVGVIRMPDVFGRLQASTCIGSLGNIFLVLGGVYLFFGKEYAIAVEQPYGLLLGILGLSVLTNGIPEAIVAFLASVGVCTPVKRALKKGGAL